MTACDERTTNILTNSISNDFASAKSLLPKWKQKQYHQKNRWENSSHQIWCSFATQKLVLQVFDILLGPARRHGTSFISTIVLYQLCFWSVFSLGEFTSACYLPWNSVDSNFVHASWLHFVDTVYLQQRSNSISTHQECTATCCNNVSSWFTTPNIKHDSSALLFGKSFKLAKHKICSFLGNAGCSTHHQCRDHRRVLRRIVTDQSWCIFVMTWGWCSGDTGQRHLLLTVRVWCCTAVYKQEHSSWAPLSWRCFSYCFFGMHVKSEPGCIRSINMHPIHVSAQTSASVPLHFIATLPNLIFFPHCNARGHMPNSTAIELEDSTECCSNYHLDCTLKLLFSLPVYTFQPWWLS